MLKRKSTVSIDRWGRVRIPSDFLKILEEKLGNEVFVTSFDSESIEIYPLEEWRHLSAVPDEKLKDPAVRKFLLRANCNGVTTIIDKWGRIQLPQWLREKTGLEGEVSIEGVGSRLILKKRCQGS